MLNDIEVKNKIMEQAKKLRHCGCSQLEKVFIKHDETKLSSKENYRLRQRKRALKELHPNAELKIERGRLLQDGTEVDKFDLNRQIFC